MFAKTFMKSVLIASIATLSLSGCANPLLAYSNQQALAEMKANPVAGFKLTSEVGPNCGLFVVVCSENYSYEFSTDDHNKSQAEVCKQVFAWAAKYGAYIWHADSYGAPIKDHENSAQFACVGVSDFNIVGNSGSIGWAIERVTSSGYWLSSFSGLEPKKSWEESFALWPPLVQRHSNVLSAIETYRMEHPEADPTAVSTVEAALKPLNLGAAIKVISNKKGEAKFLSLTGDDYYYDTCVNITPYDPNYFQAPNPGNGFYPLFLGDNTIEINEFGYTKYAACDEKN